MWLVVGLGNPGPEYADHRHNIGFLVVDELVRRWQAAGPQRKFGSELHQIDRAGERIYLQKPMEFMNLSGQAVQRAVAFYRIEPRRVIVIHDDIDLPRGRLRIKAGGGHGGHNGLRSISGAIGPAYLRVRCGIGRPSGGKEQIVGYVLGPFGRDEQKLLPEFIARAADAVEMILDRGVDRAMNEVNGNKHSGSEPV
ncbi:MAG: aminoacyl-tRNA hydrolase [Myxococcales bacterium]|nr:aminoacyl-tRNA hydrolase [Myxococcota bacterium]MDW8284207.1 aminoacyl-tRNA hydrolase [Myxococcales bacterium]